MHVEEKEQLFLYAPKTNHVCMLLPFVLPKEQFFSIPQANHMFSCHQARTHKARIVLI
jgi:hypothetical protein